MSTNVRELITTSLRRATITPLGETPDADIMQYALTTLNQMVAAWQMEGVDLGMDELAYDSILNVDTSHEQAIVDNLAVTLATDRGKTLPVILLARAAGGFKALQLKYLPDLQSDFDTAVKPQTRERFDVV